MKLENIPCFEDAYQKGQAARLRHTQAHCVLEGEALVLLATDFAHLFLFQELHTTVVDDPYARASLRMNAFQQGYLDGCRGNGVPGSLLPMRERRGQVRGHRQSKRKKKRSPALV